MLFRRVLVEVNASMLVTMEAFQRGNKRCTVSKVKMILLTNRVMFCMSTREVFVCVIIKLLIAVQSSPVIVVILCHSQRSSQGAKGESMVLVTKTDANNQTRQRGPFSLVAR